MLPYFIAPVEKECMLKRLKFFFRTNVKLRSYRTFTPFTKYNLKTKLIQTSFFLLAIDESTDIRDFAKLAVFVRFFIEDQFQEELLTVISLTGHTTGSDIFNDLVTFLEHHKLGIDKIVSIATDGAPAMVKCA